jgi:CHAT domain-containing protein
VWAQLRARAQPVTSGEILALAPKAATLPGTRDEVEAIHRIYGDRVTVLVDSSASEAALRSASSRYDIIHLATYGVLNKHNPLFSFLELQPGGGDDGRLEVHEVFGLRLNARLVVLSACQTGVGSGSFADVPAGDDWVGLVRAFLYANASMVAATLWPVEDRATAQLMEEFYRALSLGRSEVEALALAQRAALRNPRTAQPFFWAPFVLVGGS